MSAYMEMIYIDSDHQARKTRLGAIFDTDYLTLLAFRSTKRLAVPIETAKFILDCYDENEDLVDSVALSAAGFREITGQEPLTEADYRRIDAEFWAAARQTITANRKALAA